MSQVLTSNQDMNIRLFNVKVLQYLKRPIVVFYIVMAICSEIVVAAVRNYKQLIHTYLLLYMYLYLYSILS